MHFENYYESCEGYESEINSSNLSKRRISLGLLANTARCWAASLDDNLDQNVSLVGFLQSRRKAPFTSKPG